MSKHNKPSILFLVIITLFGSTGLLASDIYLASLPEMAKHFGVPQTAVQATFAVFLIGFALCQFIYGILADLIGRKKVIIVGMLVFIGASVACATVETLEMLLWCRLLQAFGAGATVINRTLIAERYGRKQAVAILTTIFPVIGMMPALAPFIGSYISAFFGWRYTFYLSAAYGALVLLLITTCLEEHERPMEKMRLSDKVFRELLTNRYFMGYVLVVCSGFAAFRSYMTESPFVFQSQGFSTADIGSFYFSVSLAYLVGNLLAKWLSKHLLTLHQILLLGFGLFVGGTGVFMLVVRIHASSHLAVILPMCIVIVGNGLIFPVASASAMTAVPVRISGTASGVLGALQCLFAALAIALVGNMVHGKIVNLAIFIGVVTLLGLASFWLLVLRMPESGKVAGVS